MATSSSSFISMSLAKAGFFDSSHPQLRSHHLLSGATPAPTAAKYSPSEGIERDFRKAHEVFARHVVVDWRLTEKDLEIRLWMPIICSALLDWEEEAVAEKAAWEVAAERGVELAVVNPVLVLGPLLQPTVNASVVHILKYLNGSAKTYANAVQAYVDVWDFAEVHLLVFEAPEAKGSRFLCPQRRHCSNPGQTFPGLPHTNQEFRRSASRAPSQ